MKADCETAILLLMYQKGLVGNSYKSTEKVRRAIRWVKIASHYREKRRFEAVARRLVKRGLLSDAGKSANVLSLSMEGCIHVQVHLEANPSALDDLDAAMRV